MFAGVGFYYFTELINMKSIVVLIFLFVSILSRSQNFSFGFRASRSFLAVLEEDSYYGSSNSWFSVDNSENSSYTLKFNSMKGILNLYGGITYNVINYDFVYSYSYYMYENGSSHFSDSRNTDYFYKSCQNEIYLDGGLRILLLSNSSKTSRLFLGSGIMINLYRKNVESMDSSITTKSYTTYSIYPGGSSYTTTSVWNGNSDDVFFINEKPGSLSFGLTYMHSFKDKLIVQLSADYDPLGYIATMDNSVMKSYLALGLELDYIFHRKSSKTSEDSF
ncbi:hypothetical protein SDC9_65016 [bioreactor metagenome]|uniref:Uncharacterized protein n=1 Tax=bioreactor metagenome TaxID=1076179 RepID=A0A644XWC8_9ZZZZ